MDVAQNPHIEGKYEVMKQRMLTQFSQSKNQCVAVIEHARSQRRQTVCPDKQHAFIAR